MMTAIARQKREQLLQFVQCGLVPVPSAHRLVGIAGGRVVE